MFQRRKLVWSNMNRMEYIKVHVRKTLHLDGDVAEAGVWKGKSAEAICDVKGKKTLHLFDTFKGLPESMFDPIDTEDAFSRIYIKPNEYAGSLNEVKTRLGQYENIKYYAGLIPDTFRGLNRNKYCFVHIDLDLFKSTFEALKHFYPRMVDGGIIMIHNYQDFRGVRIAVDKAGIVDPRKGEHKYCII